MKRKNKLIGMGEMNTRGERKMKEIHRTKLVGQIWWNLI